MTRCTRPVRLARAGRRGHHDINPDVVRSLGYDPDERYAVAVVLGRWLEAWLSASS